MDIPDIQVCELNGESLSLRKNLKEAVEALDNDGCLLLKKATDLTTVESALSSAISSPDAITKHIVLNEGVKALLFNAQPDDFHITSFKAYKAVSNDIIGRDKDWKSLAEMTGLISVSCTHLGGDSSAEWLIKVDKGIRGEATGNMYTVKANGGDIFVCNHWLRRSLPRTQKSNSEAFFIITGYMRKDLQRGKFYPKEMIDRVTQLGKDCTRSGDFAIWKGNTSGS